LVLRFPRFLKNASTRLLIGTSLVFLLVVLLVSWGLSESSGSQVTVTDAEQHQLTQGYTVTLAPPKSVDDTKTDKADEDESGGSSSGYPPDVRGGSLIGIDVSEHQGAIDWSQVAGNGVSFAFIRVGARGYTDGSIKLDEYFDVNIREATATGIKVGVYFYSQAITETEAVEEADFVLQHLNGRALDYPVVLDMETAPSEDGRVNTLPNSQWTSNAKAFCERIESGGYTPMLYGNQNDLLRFDSGLLETYDVWFAQFDVRTPSAPTDFTIWQFTNRGAIAGINALVDLDIQFFGGDLESAGVVFHED
jgi:GH25 family lysozyme M1 (1,4-beta-N-acetylmuramidase)